MARNSSGTYTRTNGKYTGSTVWQQAANNGDKIIASDHDAEMNDLATELTDSVSRSGKGSLLADLNLGGFKITNLANGINRDNVLNIGQYQDATVTWAGVSTMPTTNNYEVSLTPAIASYVEGMMIRFRVNTTNTGASTLQVNGLGAKPIRRTDGTVALTSGQLSANAIVVVQYSTTPVASGEFRIISSSVSNALPGINSDITQLLNLARITGTSGVLLGSESTDRFILTGGNIQFYNDQAILQQGSANDGAFGVYGGGNSAGGGYVKCYGRNYSVTANQGSVDILESLNASGTRGAINLGLQAQSVNVLLANGGLGGGVFNVQNQSGTPFLQASQSGGVVISRPLKLDNQTFNASAGALVTYLEVNFGGTVRKIPLYA